jgi:hypothetical protein
VKPDHYSVDITTHPHTAPVKETVQLYLCSLSRPSWHVLGWNLPLSFKTADMHIKCVYRCRDNLCKISMILNLKHIWIFHNGLSLSHPYQLRPYLILTTLTSQQTGCALYIAQWSKLSDCWPKLISFDSHKMLTTRQVGHVFVLFT